jgi:hypothetical protein
MDRGYLQHWMVLDASNYIYCSLGRLINLRYRQVRQKSQLRRISMEYQLRLFIDPDDILRR